MNKQASVTANNSTLALVMQQPEKVAPKKPAAASKAAGKPAPIDNSPLLFVPTAAQTLAILDGAAGATEWADLRGCITSIIANSATLDTLSNNLTTTLAPVLKGLSIGSDWMLRTQKAYGKKEADARHNKASAKIAMFLKSALAKKSPSLFRVTNWSTGQVIVLDAATAPDKMPLAVKNAGILGSAYTPALAAVKKAAADKAEKAAADKAAAAGKAAAGKAAAGKGKGKDKPALPAAITTPTTGKDSSSAMDAALALTAAFKDGSASRVALDVWVTLSDALALHIASQAADEAKQQAIMAKQQAKQAKQAKQAS